MPQKITTGFRAMIDEAEREIDTLSVEEALALHGREDVVFVDIRDIRELEREGRIPGASIARAGCSNSGSIPKVPTTSRSLAKTSAFCSFAPAVGARRLPRRPRIAWD